MKENWKKQNYRNLETIDLIELLNILRKRKKLIISIIILMTISSYIYVNFVAKPVYSGSTTIEIGQVINKDAQKGTVQVIDLESISTLKSLIQTKFRVSVSALNGSNLVMYSLASSDKNYIKKSLNEAIKYTLDRDKKRAKLYSGANAKIIYTKVIAPIDVFNKPVKPNKKLILIASLIFALVVSIVLALLIEFLSELKNTRQKESE